MLWYDPLDMWRSAEPKPAEPFQQLLDRLARPIEFASRDSFAHLPTVKNLDSFVCSQVMHTLSEGVYPRAVEAALLQLKNLFSEDQGRLSPQAQQRRLQEAAEILKVLRTMDHRLSSDPAGANKPAGRLAESRDLWTIPIRYVKGVGP